MNRGRFFTLGLGLALGLAACSSDDGGEESAPSFTVVSFNAGLAVGFVPAANERAPLIGDAIAGLAADLVCVQEVWFPEHVNAVKQAAAAKYPNQIFVPDDPGNVGTTPACSEADTKPLLDCAVANGCDKVCEDELVGCFLENCGTQFFAAQPPCKECLQANVGLALDKIIGNCQGGTAEYAYGGAFGIGLLAKDPILEQEIVKLPATTNQRAFIYAKLDTRFGEVHAICTHLTPVHSDVPWPKATGSWKEEQTAQIDQLLAYAQSKAQGGQLLIIGDMNTGPAGNGYSAIQADSYQKFVDAGLSNPYAEKASNPCTFCTDNPLHDVDDKGDPVVIDHVLLKDFAGSTASKRVLDGTIDVTRCGEPFTAAYSDHYGVSVTISR